MNSPELEEMFGVEVLVQMREPLFLVEVGDPAVGPVVKADGKPEIVQGPQGFGPAMREYVRPKLSDEPKAQYYLKARLAPASGGRVAICYELPDGHVAFVVVRPSDIVAATLISKLKREESKLIKP